MIADGGVAGSASFCNVGSLGQVFSGGTSSGTAINTYPLMTEAFVDIVATDLPVSLEPKGHDLIWSQSQSPGSSKIVGVMGWGLPFGAKARWTTTVPAILGYVGVPLLPP